MQLARVLLVQSKDNMTHIKNIFNHLKKHTPKFSYHALSRKNRAGRLETKQMKSNEASDMDSTQADYINMNEWFSY